MSANDKKKMCWSCEGSVPFAAESCPFCGVNLDNVMPSAVGGGYKSPYRLAKSEESEAIPVAPLLRAEQQTESEDESDQTKHVMLTLGCLSVGVIFLLFGIILFLFSGSDGTLVLRWDAHFWYVYLVIGLPLLIVGWRVLSNIVDKEE